MNFKVASKQLIVELLGKLTKINFISTFFFVEIVLLILFEKLIDLIKKL